MGSGKWDKEAAALAGAIRSAGVVVVIVEAVFSDDDDEDDGTADAPLCSNCDLRSRKESILRSKVRRAFKLFWCRDAISSGVPKEANISRWIRVASASNCWRRRTASGVAGGKEGRKEEIKYEG